MSSLTGCEGKKRFSKDLNDVGGEENNFDNCRDEAARSGGGGGAAATADSM